MYTDFEPRELNVPVSVVHSNGNNAYHCTCSTRQLHDPNCQCRCKFCDHTRSCPCQSSQQCVCPAMCNCSCDHCHKPATSTADGPQGQSREKRKHHAITEGGEERQCTSVGCEKLAPVNGQTGTYINGQKPSPRVAPFISALMDRYKSTVGLFVAEIVRETVSTSLFLYSVVESGRTTASRWIRKSSSFF